MYKTRGLNINAIREILQRLELTRVIKSRISGSRETGLISYKFKRNNIPDAVTGCSKLHGV